MRQISFILRKGLLLVLAVTLSSSIVGQGIDFFEGSYKEALEAAQKEDKLIFIDAYAKWCGPCKAMAKNVFTKDDVGNFFNKNFINLKLDMEEEESIDFKRKYSVSAYPTLFFIDGSEELVHKAVGGKQESALIQLGQLAIRKNDKSGDFAAAYESGDRSFDLVYNYVRALNNAGKPSLKISNDYLKSNPDISKDQRVLFVYESLVEIDSRLFDEYVTYKKSIIKSKGEEAYREKMTAAAWKTVAKGIEYEVELLVDEAIEKMKKNNKDNKAFQYEAKMAYAKSFKMTEDYFEFAKKYFDKYAKDDPKALKDLIMECQKSFGKEKIALKEVEKYTERLVRIESNEQNHFMYARLLVQNDRKDKALEHAKKALEIAEEKGEDTRRIKGLINYIEST